MVTPILLLLLSLPEPPLPAQPMAVLRPGQVHGDVSRTWDFVTLPTADWQWYMPGGVQGQDEQGARFQMDKDGPGPQLRDIALPAAGLASVEVEVDCVPLGDTVAQAPDWIGLYWARDDDVASGSAWPFANERAVRLLPVEGRPGVYAARLSANELWTGIIRWAYVSLNLPRNENGQPRPSIVRLRRISLSS